MRIKEGKTMKKYIVILIILISCVFPFGCSNSDNPISESGGGGGASAFYE